MPSSPRYNCRRAALTSGPTTGRFKYVTFAHNGSYVTFAARLLSLAKPLYGSCSASWRSALSLSSPQLVNTSQCCLDREHRACVRELRAAVCVLSKHAQLCSVASACPRLGFTCELCTSSIVDVVQTGEGLNPRSIIGDFLVAVDLLTDRTPAPVHACMPRRRPREYKSASARSSSVATTTTSRLAVCRAAAETRQNPQAGD